MTDKNTDNSENPTNPTEPYKKEEFDLFIEKIKGSAIGHWVQVAKVLGVDNSTIHAWKKLPQARKAISDAIERKSDKMQEVGKDDWRMWESQLKMLGVSPIEKSERDHTTKGKPIPILGNVSTNNSNPEAPETK
jgi:hypothetical protein|tara:strand:+ start:3683 stop:4084 length:402 start_codon:yes stop_codon:yes gene_type:complete